MRSLPVHVPEAISKNSLMRKASLGWARAFLHYLGQVFAMGDYVRADLLPLLSRDRPAPQGDRSAHTQRCSRNRA